VARRPAPGTSDIYVSDNYAPAGEAALPGIRQEASSLRRPNLEPAGCPVSLCARGGGSGGMHEPIGVGRREAIVLATETSWALACRAAGSASLAKLVIDAGRSNLPPTGSPSIERTANECSSPALRTRALLIQKLDPSQKGRGMAIVIRIGGIHFDADA